MKLEEILEEWKTDKIDSTDLSKSSSAIPKLHHKYISIRSNESLVLSKLKMDLRVLSFQKWEFLTQGPTKETETKGWKLPPKGVIIKNEVDWYLDADEDLNKLKAKIEYMQEKIDVLNDILKQIHNRNFQLNTILNNRRFEAGL